MAGRCVGGLALPGGGPIEEMAKVLGDTVGTVEATYVHVFALLVEAIE